jgi:hypothetical protein
MFRFQAWARFFIFFKMSRSVLGTTQNPMLLVGLVLHGGKAAGREAEK